MTVRDELAGAWDDWGRADLYKKWRRSNPGEAAKLDAYRAGGPRPVLATAAGQALVHETAAWLMSSTGTVFDVRGFGAVGDGAADDTNAIQDAIDAAGAAGGGTVLSPPGRYRLATAGCTIGALCVDHDNVTLVWDDLAVWVCETPAQGAIVAVGGAKGGHRHEWWTRQTENTTAFSILPADAGATTLTAGAPGHGLEVGDTILVRTGNTNGGDHKTPDSELNEVTSVNGPVIGLRWPLLKSYRQEWFQTANQTTTLVADAAPGDTHITVADPSGFGWAWLTIGDPGGNMHSDMANGVPSGNTIPLTGTISRSIPAGTTVNRGTGFTSTVATGAPAVLGAAKITDRVVRNLRLVNPRWDSLTGPGAAQIDAVIGFRMEGGHIRTRGGAMHTGNVRFARFDKNRVHHPPENQGDYSFGLGKGTGVVRFDSPVITSEGTGGIVASEGSVDVGIIDPHVSTAPGAGGWNNQNIAFQTRSGGRLIGGVSRGAGTGYAVGVDQGCRPGLITGTDIDGPGMAVLVQSPGWIVTGCRVATQDKILLTSTGSTAHNNLAVGASV